MTDPAVEAAERAWDSREPGVLKIGVHMEAAARQALAPLRKLHRPVRFGAGRKVCHHCWTSDGDYALWPCVTAPFIYREDELNA